MAFMISKHRCSLNVTQCRSVSSPSTEPWGIPYTAASQRGSSGSLCRAGALTVGRFPKTSRGDEACSHQHTRTSWPNRNVADFPFACDSVCRGTWSGYTCRNADAQGKESRDSLRLEETTGNYANHEY